MKSYSAFIDGASSGNPGESGIGILILKDNKEILRESKYIGKTTNNVAEYTALLTLLYICKKYKINKIKIFTDSELLVKQLNGEYKINNKKLKDIVSKIKKYDKYLKYELIYIAREKNKIADKLAKDATKRSKKLKNNK